MYMNVLHAFSSAITVLSLGTILLNVLPNFKHDDWLGVVMVHTNWQTEVSVPFRWFTHHLTGWNSSRLEGHAHVHLWQTIEPEWWMNNQTLSINSWYLSQQELGRWHVHHDILLAADAGQRQSRGLQGGHVQRSSCLHHHNDTDWCSCFLHWSAYTILLCPSILYVHWHCCDRLLPVQHNLPWCLSSVEWEMRQGQ